MSTKGAWFSHKERRWEVKRKWTLWGKKFFSWTDKNSRYLGDKPVELRFTLGFKVTEVDELEKEFKPILRFW